MFELKSIQPRQPVSDREIQAPPHAFDAEVDVLANMLVYPDVISMVADKLNPEDFYNRAHQRIYRAARDLRFDGEPVTTITVRKILRDRNQLDEVGGHSYLMQLVSAQVSRTSIDWSASQIIEAAQRRALIKVALERMQQAADPEVDVSQLLAQISSNVHEIASRKPPASEIDMRVIASNVIEKIWDQKERRALPGISTGFANVDDFTGGYVPGELTVVAGRSSMGKSDFMCSMALKILQQADAAIFSVETGKETLMKRVLAQHGQIARRKLRFADLTDDDWKVLLRAATFEGLHTGYFFDAADDIDTPAKLRAHLVRLKLAGQMPAAVLIDHLHEMDSDREYRDDRQKYEQICKDSRTIAREMGVPIILLAQLNRAVEGQQNKRPELHHLRESGAIEQVADIVMMVYRDEYYNPESEANGEAEVLVRKCRDGERGTAYFFYSVVTGSWVPQSSDYQPRVSAPVEKPKRGRYSSGGTAAGMSAKE